MPGFEALTEFANWSTDTLAEYPYSGWLISYMRPRKSTTDVVDILPAIAINVGSVPVGVSSAVANAGAPRLRALTRQVSKTSPRNCFLTFITLFTRENKIQVTVAKARDVLAFATVPRSGIFSWITVEAQFAADLNSVLVFNGLTAGNPAASFIFAENEIFDT